MIWDDLKALLATHDSFLISSHLSLDGDSVGSQLAFYWYLTSLGKRAAIYDVDPVPDKFTFLTNSQIFSTVKPADSFDALVVLDCSNLRRLGWEEQAQTFPVIFNLDHHRDNTRFGKLNIVETDAAATGEILHRFFTREKLEYPPHVAEALYAAIMTDTGGFRFSNTTSKILRTCADLADRGADCAHIYEEAYSSHSRHALLLQARIWSSLEFHRDGKICSMRMPLSILEELGAQYSDSEGMADHTISARGVEVGIMMKCTETETHFSLRSRGSVDVGRIAQSIPGGGGHSCAAGCTLYRPCEQALEQMLAIIERELH